MNEYQEPPCYNIWQTTQITDFAESSTLIPWGSKSILELIGTTDILLLDKQMGRLRGGGREGVGRRRRVGGESTSWGEEVGVEGGCSSMRGSEWEWGRVRGGQETGHIRGNGVAGGRSEPLI